jgi:hypothetical protein
MSMAKVHAILCAMFESADYKPTRQQQGKRIARAGQRDAVRRNRMAQSEEYVQYRCVGGGRESKNCSNARWDCDCPIASGRCRLRLLRRYKNMGRIMTNATSAVQPDSYACSFLGALRLPDRGLAFGMLQVLQ